MLREETGSPVSMYARTTSVKICWWRFCCNTVGLMTFRRQQTSTVLAGPRRYTTILILV
jgi:hypothetical protein